MNFSLDIMYQMWMIKVCFINHLTLLCRFSTGYFIEPTIIETKNPDDKLMNEVSMHVIYLSQVYPPFY